MPTSLLTPGKLLVLPSGATSHGWHSIEAFIRCPKEHQLASVRGIEPLSLEMRMPFAVGILLHAARAQWLNDGGKGDLWKKAIIEAEKREKRFPVNARDVALLTFAEYVRHWSVRPRFQVLAVEYELKPRGLAKNAPEWARRGARLDSIERDPQTGEIWAGEAKSTQQGPSKVHDNYLLHGQVLLQMALWGEEETKLFGPLAGVLLDVIKKHPEPKCYDRIKLRTADATHALEWFKRDMKGWLLQSQMVDWASKPERRPQCVRQYGPCDFRDLCLGGKKHANEYVFRDGRRLTDWKPTAEEPTPPWE